MRTLHSVTLDEFDALTSAQKRAIDHAARLELERMGYAPADYVLEAVKEPGGDVVLRFHEVDPLTRPLTFDDRGIT